MIAIIDYGMGNLRSVSKALEYLGAPYRLCPRGKDLVHASKVILPGVGAFGDAMKELKARGEPNYKIYDITLKLVDQPGLPAPTVKTNAVVAIKTPSSPHDEVDEEKDDTTPAIDPTLEETKHILQDLIVLTEKSKALAEAVK